jgi:gliding motility-associated lipoprotein GldH
MRFFFGFTIIICLVFSCDDERVYEKNIDFDSGYWLVSEKPEFEFEIADTLQSYNLYCNVRNTVAYPFARIFLTCYLQDSSGLLIEKKLVGQLLFDAKTGEPQGNSGLGDIFDHQIPFKTNYRFDYAGKYKVKLEQYMRTDTLSGVLAVGFRVEKFVNSKQ